MQWKAESPKSQERIAQEIPKQTAIRELKEETGYVIDEMIYLGSMNLDSGYIILRCTDLCRNHWIKKGLPEPSFYAMLFYRRFCEIYCKFKIKLLG